MGPGRPSKPAGFQGCLPPASPASTSAMIDGRQVSLLEGAVRRPLDHLVSGRHRPHRVADPPSGQGRRLRRDADFRDWALADPVARRFDFSWRSARAAACKAAKGCVHMARGSLCGALTKGGTVVAPPPPQLNEHRTKGTRGISPRERARSEKPGRRPKRAAARRGRHRRVRSGIDSAGGKALRRRLQIPSRVGGLGGHVSTAPGPAAAWSLWFFREASPGDAPFCVDRAGSIMLFDPVIAFIWSSLRFHNGRFSQIPSGPTLGSPCAPTRKYVPARGRTTMSPGRACFAHGGVSRSSSLKMATGIGGDVAGSEPATRSFRGWPPRSGLRPRP